MKKLYILLFTMLMTSLSFGQTEIFNLAGGGALPSGWTSSNPDTTNPIDKGTYYLVETDGNVYDNITSNVIDLSAYSLAVLDLKVATFGSGTNNPAKIEISYDGGTSFTQVETTATPSSSTYIAGGPINLSSVSSQVQIRISNNGTSDRGVRLRNLVLTAFSSSPFIDITAPSNMAVFSAGTTNVDVVFNTGNTNVGDQVNIKVNGTPNNNVTSPFSITTANGGSYNVVAELVDSSNTVLDSKTIDFSVSLPCDLNLGTITTTCDAQTSGIDTYTTTIDFTGGGTSLYTISSGAIGSIGGDDPSLVASGQIIITSVDEGTDFVLNITGDIATSSCNITRNISSPVCFTAVCANAGDVIITEVMQNPSINTDPAGEYIELYNTTAAPINIQGWVIKDDVSASESHTIGASLIIPANGYIVIGNAAMPNGGVTLNYTYANDISLGNTTDGVILECSSTMIDQVIWSSSFPFSSGVAMELSASNLDATSNDTASNWGAATATFGDGDKGSPGAANDFTLSSSQFENGTFNIYPNPTNLGYVNISSRSEATINVSVFDVLGKQVINETVSNKRLNVSKLTSGIYIVKAIQDNASTTKKLVIK